MASLIAVSRTVAGTKFEPVRPILSWSICDNAGHGCELRTESSRGSSNQGGLPFKHCDPRG